MARHQLTFTAPGEPISTKVLIGEQLDPDFTSLAALASCFVIITDTDVEELFGTALRGRMQKEGLITYLFSFPAGEEYKTRETKQLIENKMFEEKIGKDTCIIALGGGVVCDLAGFLASTYCRGVPYISIPTSLLAMVDGAIGGKTGVDTPHGKNLIGTFYPPKKVLIDTITLQSLPEKEWRCGAAEIIKYGLIASKDLFGMLERRKEEWRAKSSVFIQELIYESASIKKRIIEADFKEKGIRRSLNFGHTIGHAIEALSYYKTSHGDAIALGMLAESFMSMKLGFLTQKSLDKILALFKKFHFPFILPTSFSFETVKNQILLDKKTEKGHPRFSLIASIGEAHPFDGSYCTSIEDPLLKESIEWLASLAEI